MRTLLIDTSGDGASIALAEHSAITASRSMAARSASANLVASVATLLAESRWTPKELHAIGVVNGPGSFTGVRVGLSSAKGLAEALSIPVIAVSRLQVLAALANMRSGYAALNAGRGEIFVLDVASGRESLQTRDFLLRMSQGVRIAICEWSLADALSGLDVEVYELSAASALKLVQQRLSAGENDRLAVDANYLRGEQQIYGRITA